MKIIAEIIIDEDQAKNRLIHITDDIRFAIAGALNLFRDGNGRHSAIIDYEVDVKIVED
ncbi:hypothetical protein HYP99_gp016 [Sinorhizobium phage ort11]|uniref:Uncharacterized protein n=1 Tax=Sinorhizobium phage ort11 TaxID=2599764 RepID=A0A5C2H1B3_9CAUD|nr:hypothetical protein HYP99_gp016 [Sinorhizobium phage ort11]QEP29814.1 hypothetical protein Smphiort11_016 [Sinorhizobium phage ort11]